MGFCPYLTITPQPPQATVQQAIQIDDYTTLLATMTQQQKVDQIIIPFTCPETTACQLWDVSSAMCGAKVTPKVQQFIDKFKEIVGDTADLSHGTEPAANALVTERNIQLDILDLIARFTNIVGAAGEKVAGADLGPSSILQIMEHIHVRHEGQPNEGHTSDGTKINKLLELPLEQLTGLDCNGDGKVYGKDFQISDPPPLLADLPDNPGFNADAPSVTMADYLAD